MFKRVKECTGSFTCRFKSVLVSTALIIAVAVGGIILFVE